MNNALIVFNALIHDTKGTRALYDYIDTVVHPPMDYSDLLRWQWAQAASALDKLVHDLVRIGMIEIYQGMRKPTKKYLSFPLTVEAHAQMVGNPGFALQLFEQQVSLKHSYLAFQEPDKISDSLSNIWNENHKWQCIANELSLPEDVVKTQLRNISIRRNQIVHEGDYSNIILQRQNIAKEDVTEVIDFVEKLGVAIYTLVKL